MIGKREQTRKLCQLPEERNDNYTTRRREEDWEFPLSSFAAARREHERDRMQHDNSNANSTAAFLQSTARELRYHLKSFGHQASLDISSGGGGERFSEPYGYRPGQGLFRPRNESIWYDIDNSTSTVNRLERINLALTRHS